MPQKRNEFAAGLFILLSIALGSFVYVAIRGAGVSLEARANHVARFDITDDVGGIRPGSEVRLGGVKLGQVSSVEIDGKIDGKIDAKSGPIVLVEFNLPARFELKQDAVIDIQTGLTGSVNLNISSLGTGQVATSPIPGKGSAMNRLFAELASAGGEINQAVRDVRQVTLPRVNSALEVAPDTVASIRATAKNADGLITDVRARVEPVIERYNKTTDAATVAMNEVSEFAGGGKADFRQTLANVNKVTGDVKERLPGLLDRATLAIDDVRVAVAHATEALDTVKDVATNAKDATAAARSVLVTNRGRIDEMVKGLRSTSNNLEAASVEIRRSPWRLLYKPTDSEQANLNLYDSARQIATASQRLADATVALRDAAADPDVDSKTVEALLATLNNAFADLKKVEGALWEGVK